MEITNISIIDPVGGHGGMDYYDHGLAMGLGANQVKVDLYTCSKTPIRNFNNVKTYHTFRDFWDRGRLSKLLYFLLYFSKAVISTRKRGANIIHLHFFAFTPQNLLILFISKLSRLNVVVTMHDIESFSKETIPVIEKICYGLVDGMIVHNRSSLEYIQVKNIKLPKTEVIPHGNYIPFIKRSYNHNDSNSHFNLLFFGQIKKVKGIEILLEGLGELKRRGVINFVLNIAGKVWKDDFSKYQDIIAKHNLTENVVIDLRYIPDEEVPFYFAKTDLVVLPYKKIYQSGVLLKAMSYSKAVLVSNLDPFVEIINDCENGFVFESENPNSLAEKLIYIINNRNELPQIANNAFNYVKEHNDWVKIGSKTLEFYKEVCS